MSDAIPVSDAMPTRYQRAAAGEPELPQLSAEEVKRTEAGREPMFDYCECVKTPGAWGQGRFHLYRLTQARCQARAREEIRVTLRREGPMGAEDESILRRQIEERWMRYLGTVIAYEQCPKMTEIIQQRQEEKKEASRGYRLAEGL